MGNNTSVKLTKLLILEVIIKLHLTINLFTVYSLQFTCIWYILEEFKVENGVALHRDLNRHWVNIML